MLSDLKRLVYGEWGDTRWGHVQRGGGVVRFKNAQEGVHQRAIWLAEPLPLCLHQLSTGSWLLPSWVLVLAVDASSTQQEPGYTQDQPRAARTLQHPQAHLQGLG